MSKTPILGMFIGVANLATTAIRLSGQDASVGNRKDGKRLFERETFGGQQSHLHDLSQHRNRNRVAGGCATTVYRRPGRPALGSETTISSPDPWRAVITGESSHTIIDGLPIFDTVNAFKVPQLRGVSNTAPYFHDNSAKTLEDLAAHYAIFFAIVTNWGLILTEEDQADIVAYMKLL